MLPAIGQLVSDTFYGDLKHGRDNPIIPANVLPEALSNPLTWISTDELGAAAFESMHSDGKSRINRKEIDCILKLLSSFYHEKQSWEWLTSQKDYPHGIGVICTYAAQREQIRKKIRDLTFGEQLLRYVKIDTVDSYQGKENPIVIVSLVRNNLEGSQFHGIATIREGFLSDDSRINVSVSRAMDKLIIVGAKDRWQPSSPMGRLVSNFDKTLSSETGRVISAYDFLQEEDEQESQMSRSGKAKGVEK